LTSGWRAAPRTSDVVYENRERYRLPYVEKGKKKKKGKKREREREKEGKKRGKKRKQARDWEIIRGSIPRARSLSFVFVFIFI